MQSGQRTESVLVFVAGGAKLCREPLAKAPGMEDGLQTKVAEPPERISMGGGRRRARPQGARSPAERAAGAAVSHWSVTVVLALAVCPLKEAVAVIV